jgi:hypothetical protein
MDVHLLGRQPSMRRTPRTWHHEGEGGRFCGASTNPDRVPSRSEFFALSGGRGSKLRPRSQLTNEWPKLLSMYGATPIGRDGCYRKENKVFGGYEKGDLRLITNRGEYVDAHKQPAGNGRSDESVANVLMAHRIQSASHFGTRPSATVAFVTANK